MHKIISKHTSILIMLVVACVVPTFTFALSIPAAAQKIVSKTITQSPTLGACTVVDALESKAIEALQQDQKTFLNRLGAMQQKLHDTAPVSPAAPLSQLQTKFRALKTLATTTDQENAVDVFASTTFKALVERDAAYTHITEHYQLQTTDILGVLSQNASTSRGVFTESLTKTFDDARARCATSSVADIKASIKDNLQEHQTIYKQAVQTVLDQAKDALLQAQRTRDNAIKDANQVFDTSFISARDAFVASSTEQQ